MNAPAPAAIDARVPIRLAAGPLPDLAPADACLREGRGADGPNQAWFQAAAALQQAGCGCCPPRNPAGVAMAALLFAAARGQAPPFQRLVIITTSPEGEAAVRHAMANDPLVKARFRCA